MILLCIFGMIGGVIRRQREGSYPSFFFILCIFALETSISQHDESEWMSKICIKDHITIIKSYRVTLYACLSFQSQTPRPMN
jgi:hypothetical protein